MSPITKRPRGTLQK